MQDAQHVIKKFIEIVNTGVQKAWISFGRINTYEGIGSYLDRVFTTLGYWE